MQSILIEFHPLTKWRKKHGLGWTAYVVGPFTIFFCNYSMATAMAEVLGVSLPDERQQKLF